MCFIHLNGACSVQTAKRGCHKKERKEEGKQLMPLQELRVNTTGRFRGGQTFRALHPSTRAWVTAVICPRVPESS